MSIVVRKSDFYIIHLANTPDYSTDDWLINPSNLSTLIGAGTYRNPDIPKIYWIEDSNNLREMTQGEKDAVNSNPDILISEKIIAKKKIYDSIPSFISSRYPPDVRTKFDEIKTTAVGNARTLLNNYYDWIFNIYKLYDTYSDYIDTLNNVTDIRMTSIDFTDSINQDPNISIDDLLSSNFGIPKEGIYIISNPLITSTGTVYQDKLSIQNQQAYTGKYKFTISYGWDISDYKNRMFVVIQENDGSGWRDIGRTYKHRIPAFNRMYTKLNKNDLKEENHTARIFEKNLTSGTYSWRLRFRSEKNGSSVSIWDSYMRVEFID